MRRHLHDPLVSLVSGSLTHAPIYIGLLGLLIGALAINTSLNRLRTGSFKDFGGDEQLRRASRAHGLAVEHGLPLLLFLLVLELQGTAKGMIDFLGCAVLLARLLHASGPLLQQHAAARAGVVLTYALEVAMPLGIIVLAIRAL